MSRPGASTETPAATDREPDYRFTLANERTFLAWIRTALALLAGGVAVGQLFATEADETGHRALGAVCIALAALLAMGAFFRWRGVQAAMRRDEPLPTSLIVYLTISGVAVATTVCAVLVLW